MREYVATTVGPHYLADLLQFTCSPGNINWESLPRNFVIKANHGSGGIVIVTETANRATTLPRVGSRNRWGRFTVHPDTFDVKRAEDLCAHWLTLNYEWQVGKNAIEWAYRNIEPGILIQELLPDSHGEPLEDLRFYVINGHVSIIVKTTEIKTLDLATEKYTELVDVMSPDWEWLDVTKDHSPRSCEIPTEPPRLKEMIHISEKLAAHSDFLRVDFLVTHDRCVVNELTNYPRAGKNTFDPPSLSRSLANSWSVDYGPLR